jgi:hypothetical protein
VRQLPHLVIGALVVTNKIMPRKGTTLVAVAGGILSLFHIIYLIGLTGTGFADYGSFATLAAWPTLIAILLVNVALFSSRWSQAFGRWHLALMVISLVASAFMMAPILYVILDLGRAQP